MTLRCSLASERASERERERERERDKDRDTDTDTEGDLDVMVSTASWLFFFGEVKWSTP